MILDLMLSIFPERATRKDSGNSSKPPSRKPIGMKPHPVGAEATEKAKRKRPQRSNRRVSETVTVPKVLFCDVCGEDLS